MVEISVVVPTHNRSGLLAQTLRSVLWQRGVDLEVLVVDDGSTDDTAEVVAVLDDDDLWAPDKLARQLAAAQATGRSWVYTGAVNIDDDLRVLGGMPPYPP